MPFKINSGDVIVTKKNHPCGGNRWKVIRTGADFVIKCETCEHQTWIPRVKLEKSIKEIIPKE
jgi:hypothetical protein